MRPRLLVDISKDKETTPFCKKEQIINLGRHKKPVYLRAKSRLGVLLAANSALAVCFFFFFFFVFNPVFDKSSSFIGRLAVAPAIIAAQVEDDAVKKRKDLEAELAEYEKQIEEYESTIADLGKQGKSLSAEISRLNAKISKLNLQIKSVNLSLKKLDEEINATQTKIHLTENDIEFNKKAIIEILQNVYENEEKGLLEVILANPKLSDFFGDINDLLAVQDNLKISLKKIVELRDKLVDEKEVLALERADAEELKDYQNSQKAQIESAKKEKDGVLKITKGKESEYKKLLTETKKTAAEIRKQIFKLLGGGELSFEDAYKLAKFAESATGIRAALILAVLDRESALGKNVGQCNYKTAMHPKRDIPIFLEITKKLGLNHDNITVSCPISSDGDFGGAIGPAQFIPSTWALYEDKIAEISGSNPPNPWKNSDAFIATALYLKDAYNSGSCVDYANNNGNVSPKQTLQERCAAAKYYAGGRWYRFRWIYGEPVVKKADAFQEDIDILNG